MSDKNEYENHLSQPPGTLARLGLRHNEHSGSVHASKTKHLIWRLSRTLSITELSDASEEAQTQLLSNLGSSIEASLNRRLFQALFSLT